MIGGLLVSTHWRESGHPAGRGAGLTLAMLLYLVLICSRSAVSIRAQDLLRTTTNDISTSCRVSGSNLVLLINFPSFVPSMTLACISVETCWISTVFYLNTQEHIRI